MYDNSKNKKFPLNERAVLMLAITIVLFSIGNYLINGLHSGLKYKGGDFLNYYVNGKLMMMGVNIHDDTEREEAVAKAHIFLRGEQTKRHHQPDYPPFWYLMMWLLTGFRWEIAFYIWVLINQVILIFTFYFLFKYFSIKLYSVESVLVLFIFLNFYPLFYTLMEGQVNILLLFLVAWSLWLFKRRVDWAAGLLLGLAVGIKIVPAFLLFYFLWKRNWQVVIFGVIGFFATLIISAAGAGSEIVLSYFTQQLPKYGAVPRPEVFNQSINGFFSRLFTSTDSSNGWIYSPFTAGILTKISSVIVLIMTLIFTWGKSGRCSMNWNLGLGIFIVTMLMISSWTMEHLLIFLYIPYLIVLLGYFRNEGIAFKTALIFAVLFIILAFNLPYTSARLNSGILILVKSLKFYPLIIIWLLLYLESRRLKISR
ncbi:MAG: DUF2029 domain-containing protein [candidate division Zixibacteria bacterium]|nr:DUF2029 domain-containing protein [Candidatus Tariuqbacter arcticus]